jgi:serine/threonine protein kinase
MSGARPATYLVMELLEGESLHARLTRGPLDLKTLVDHAIALADALAAAHARGIIHRDLKPANILTARGVPTILDFGLARVVDPSDAATREANAPITAVGTTVGTVAYMSPEQLRGEPLDARTDLFSLGLVLYEMATGRPAFPGSTSAVISAAILHRTPVAPREIRPDLPAALEHVMLKALEKDRDIRCQTASDLRADVTRFKRHLEEHPMPGVATASVTPPPTDAVPLSAPAPGSSDAQLAVALVRRHRGLAVMIPVAALAFAAALYLGLRWRGRPPATAPAPSIENLRISQLTSTGNAYAPAISPDGKYVVYIQREGDATSLWVDTSVRGARGRSSRASPTPSSSARR